MQRLSETNCVKTLHLVLFILVPFFEAGGGGGVLAVALCVLCVDHSKQLRAYPSACSLSLLRRESEEQKGEKLMYRIKTI